MDCGKTIVLKMSQHRKVQNIDNLHERGGNKNIIHMHGELLKSRCSVSNQVIEETGDILTGDLCHCCQMPSQMRPHVVWFGEMPLRMGEIYSALETEPSAIESEFVEKRYGKASVEVPKLVEELLAHLESNVENA